MRKIARGGAGVGSLPKRKGHGGAQRRRGRGKGKVFHRMWQNEDPEKSEFYTVSTEFSTVFCEKSRFKRVKIEKSENCGIFPKAEKGRACSRRACGGGVTLLLARKTKKPPNGDFFAMLFALLQAKQLCSFPFSLKGFLKGAWGELFAKSSPHILRINSSSCEWEQVRGRRGG